MPVLQSWVLFAIELVSTGLALFIVYTMFKVLRATRREYLLGFPFGFGFLGVGYIVFGVSYAVPGLGEVGNWLHLTLACYGFAFIAGTYFLRRRRLWKRTGRAAVWLFSLLIVLAVIAIATITIPSSMILPPYRTVDEFFRSTNLILLAYILISLYEALRRERLEVGATVLSGFILLAGNEYSLLIYALDYGFSSLILAHVMQVAGLTILAFALGRGPRRG